MKSYHGEWSESMLLIAIDPKIIETKWFKIDTINVWSKNAKFKCLTIDDEMRCDEEMNKMIHSGK